MNYIFKIPETIKINQEMVKVFHGGFCSQKNNIYLFGVDFDDFQWENIIIHEHLHALLLKFGISIEFHHSIIDRMEIQK
jgi:hypothetical protein